MNPVVASTILAPSGDSPDASGNYTRDLQTLSGTGTAESHNARKLTAGSMATLVVGEASVRVVFRSAAGLADVVAIDSMIFAAGSTFTWTVDKYTRHVYVEAANGTSPYEAWVWRSST